MWEDLLLLVFPERCIGCNKSGNALCALCESTITTKPHALSTTSASLFDYRQPLVKKALWALKYHRKRALGKYFGIALYREFFKPLAREKRGVGGEIMLVPIPASIKAVAMRGYNHSSVIAAAIVEAGKADGLMLLLERNLLFKKRENTRQVEARTKHEREKNAQHVFGVRNGNVLTGKTVILIDDVTTTGATIKDARRALLQWKPKRILAVIAAH